MIEYDYKIIRDEGDEEEVYVPDKIKQELDNLTRIKGENSSGKSTLLNLIALAFYGLRNDDIPNSLQREMKNLKESDHQDLEFEISIKDGEEELVLESRKEMDKPDIIVKEVDEDGKQNISADRFQDNYRLIYDIPEDPLSRINKVAEEVQRTQRKYGGRIKDLKKELRDLREEIRVAKDPDRLEDLKNKLQGTTQKKKEVESDIESLKEFLEILRGYTYSTYYHQHAQRFDKELEELEDLEEEGEEFEERQEQVPEKLQKKEEKVQELEKDYDEFLEFLRRILPSDYSDDIETGEDLDFDPSKENNYEFEDEVYEQVSKYRDIINEEMEELNQQESFKEAKLYEKLIDLLENYRGVEMEIPGLQKPVDEFLDDIKKMKGDKEDVLNRYNKLEEADERLTEIEGNISEIKQKFLRELKKIRPSEGSGQEARKISRKIARKEEKLDDLKEKVEFYQQKYAEEGKPDKSELKEEDDEGLIPDFKSMTEEQLRDKIEDKEEELEKKEERLGKLEKKEDRFGSEIEELENKDEHKYQDKQKKVEKMMDVVNHLDKKLNRDFKEYISDIIDDEVDESDNLSDEEERYYSSLFSYLADKVGFVRHVDDEYTLENIDLIQDEIVTEGGKVIKFQDMGTGQSQSAYLKSLLETTDDKKIIALFDEVAMLDKNSKDIVLDKMRELYEQNELLVGIVVEKKDEGVEVTTFNE